MAKGKQKRAPKQPMIPANESQRADVTQKQVPIGQNKRGNQKKR